MREPFWYILLLNGGASFARRQARQEQKRAIPQRDSPLVASLYVAYSLVLHRRPAYPANPINPLPRSRIDPGSGTNSYAEQSSATIQLT